MMEKFGIFEHILIYPFVSFDTARWATQDERIIPEPFVVSDFAIAKLYRTKRNKVEESLIINTKLSNQYLDHKLTITAPAGSHLEISLLIKNCTGKLSLDLQPESGSSITVSIRALLNNEHLTIETKQIHTTANATTSTELNTVLTGPARLDYRASISIEKNAFGTCAVQQNKNLILDTQARVIALPMLEVLCNDVECSHGSATEYIDPMIEYALVRRGIKPAHARAVLINAFIGEEVV